MARIRYNKPTVIPCPDCGKTENRDYSIFLDWLATPEDMDRLLAWVKVSPCYACETKRKKQEKATYQGGRPKKGANYI